MWKVWAVCFSVLVRSILLDCYFFQIWRGSHVIVIFQMSESDGNVRRYSLLTAGQLDAAKRSSQLNLKHTFSLTHRFESTATASDASATPPAEKFEYQAEACSLE